MKRYNIYDVYDKKKNQCFYLTSHGNLKKVAKSCIGVMPEGYIEYHEYTYLPRSQRWVSHGSFNQYQLVEYAKNWTRITEAEAFIEIL